MATTAFMLDENVAVTAAGGTIPGFPGLWVPGVAYAPEALGLTLKEMRDLIARVGAPLVEVKSDDAETEFTRDPDHLASQSNIGHPLQESPGFVDPEAVGQVDASMVEAQAELVESVAASEADTVVMEASDADSE